MGEVHRGLDHRGARPHRRRAGGVGLLLPHQAAAPPGERRAGGALPRGARAVAAGDAHQRRRSEPPRRDAAVAGARAAARRAGDRGVLHRQRVAARRGGAAAPLGRDAGRCRRRRRRRSSCSGPAVLRNALSAILLVSRSVEAAAPYRIEVLPGNATVPKGADQTITARLQGFDAEDASLMVRRSPQGAFEPLPLVRDDRRRVRRDGVRHRGAAGVLRRGRRCAVGGLHAEGRGRAVRAASRARVPLPGLHRPRAAEDRGRRRHRRAARHRGAAPRHPDDEDAERPARAQRQGVDRAVGAGGRRLAHGRVQGGQATGSTASSCRRRPASASRRRRSTRSTC